MCWAVSTIAEITVNAKIVTTDKQTKVKGKWYLNLYASIVIEILCLFLLLYVPCQQLWSLRDGQFT